MHGAIAPPLLFGSVLGALNMGVVVLDADRKVVLWNSWMVRHSGLAAAQVIGQDFFALFPEVQGKRLDSAVQQALRDNFPSVLSQTLHKAPLPLFSAPAAGPGSAQASERMQQAVAVTPIDGCGARHCLIQIADVSVAVHRERLLREQALELRSQSFSDGLTGIANRRHFDVALEKELRRAKRAASPLSLLMIDIDYFKPYNDSYGHQQGDDTLIRVATTLAAMLRRPLDLIARYGGEEFGVILPEMDAAHSARLAEAMRQRIYDLDLAHTSADGIGRVTVSIGLATHHGDSSYDGATLVGAADRALYAAKNSGRNRVCVASEALHTS